MGVSTFAYFSEHRATKREHMSYKPIEKTGKPFDNKPEIKVGEKRYKEVFPGLWTAEEEKKE